MQVNGKWVRQLCRAGLVLGFVSAALPPWCGLQSVTLAQSMSSTWECLPNETVVAVRIPDGVAFAEAIVRGTKFGAVLFSEQRQAAVMKLLESSDSGEWSEFQEQLKEYGLSLDDIVQLLARESGYAVLMCGEEEQEPVFAGLGWLEPGEDLATRVVEAVAKGIEEQDDAEHPITRVDLKLADYPVMQLRVPSIGVEYDEDFQLGDDYSDLSEQEQEAAWEEAHEAWQESAVESITYRTVLVSRLGGRLLFAHSYQGHDQEAAAAVAADELSAVFGQLLVAHAGGTGGFVTRVGDDPGVARVLALDGLAVLEVLGDVKPLVGVLRATAPSSVKAEQVVRIMGLDDLGPFAVRSALDGSQWHTRIAVAAPAPRQGLLGLLDQEALAMDPPSWVPASTVRYQQWSFDLGKAYAIIKEEVMREFPGQAAAAFAMAEAQVQEFAQASLPEVLSSLGNRHIGLSFGIDPADPGEGDQLGTERTAIVWRVSDEQVWSQLMKAVAPFVASAEGFEFAEEQGFSGWRLKQAAHEGGLFLGKGYLVLAYGSGVLETMLSSLNNPPTGPDALRGTKIYAEAGSMLDLQPGLGVEITDGNRYAAMLHRWLGRLLRQREKMLESHGDIQRAGGGDNGQLGIALAQAIMPSKQEIEGMMGVIVGRWEVNEDGVFGSTAQEMPAP